MLKAMAQAQTVAVLEELGPRQKRTLLRFLYESNLLEVENSVIKLDKAHLSNAALSEVDLSRADLGGADLREANLSGATQRLPLCGTGPRLLW
jgi:uncharacterized protein YjbI with pentapeptide repeats